MEECGYIESKYSNAASYSDKFATNLKKIRKEKKLTQESLANLVNTTKTTISNYENGYSTPSIDMLVFLANTLEVTTDKLLGRGKVGTKAESQVVIIQKEKLKKDGPRQLGLYLRELRGNRPLRQIADESGLSHTYISNLEKGIRQGSNTPTNPSIDTLYKLSKIYGVSLNELTNKLGYSVEEITETNSNFQLAKDIEGELKTLENIHKDALFSLLKLKGYINLES